MAMSHMGGFAKPFGLRDSKEHTIAEDGSPLAFARPLIIIKNTLTQ